VAFAAVRASLPHALGGQDDVSSEPTPTKYVHTCVRRPPACVLRDDRKVIFSRDWLTLRLKNIARLMYMTVSNTGCSVLRGRTGRLVSGSLVPHGPVQEPVKSVQEPLKTTQAPVTPMQEPAKPINVPIGAPRAYFCLN